MKFQKNDIIIPVESAYPSGALTVDGYDNFGSLLAHPLGGGFQCCFKQNDQMKFRVVSTEEKSSILWHKAKFTIEGAEGDFYGWTDGQSWNGWAKPYFEFNEAERVVDVLTESKGRYNAERDYFVTFDTDGADEIWESQTITLLGNQQVKVYGVGAGAWIWEEQSVDAAPK